MVRRGYVSELKAKKELEKIYGKGNVIKVAIGGAEDFLVIGCGGLIKVVEVKEVHNRKYCPSKREKGQFERIVSFSTLHKIPAELWIYSFFGTGNPIVKEIKLIREYK